VYNRDRIPNDPPTRDLNIWLCGRRTGLSVMGVRMGVWVNQKVLTRLIHFSKKNCYSIQILGVAHPRNKRSLHTSLRNLDLTFKFSIFDSFRDIRVHTYDILRFVGGLLALKWAWHPFIRSIVTH